MHMLASAVIYNSAFFTVSEDPSILKAHGLDSFVSPLPVVWNETHVLPGSKIGEIAIFARRSENNGTPPCLTALKASEKSICRSRF